MRNCSPFGLSAQNCMYALALLVSLNYNLNYLIPYLCEQLMLTLPTLGGSAGQGHDLPVGDL